MNAQTKKPSQKMKTNTILAKNFPPKMMVIIVIIIQIRKSAKKYIVKVHLLNIAQESLTRKKESIVYQKMIRVAANTNPVKI